MIVSQIKDLIQTTEVMLFIEEVYLNLLRYPVFWKIQLTQLTLQLLCVCEVSLNITGECSSLIHLLEHSVELLKEVRIVRSFNISYHLHWSFSSKVSILFYLLHIKGFFHLILLDHTFVTPWTLVCWAPLSMEFSRQENWSG